MRCRKCQDPRWEFLEIHHWNWIGDTLNLPLVIHHVLIVASLDYHTANAGINWQRTRC